MLLRSIFSGLISAYLVVAPCLLIDHSSPVADATGTPIAHTHDDHTHADDTGDTEDQEHCCEDLSTSLHAPLKQKPTSIAVVVVAPIATPVHIPTAPLDLRTALSRDGPLYEQARQQAHTLVMLT